MSRDARVRKIRFNSRNLSEMTPELSAGVLWKLEDVTLDFNNTTMEQIEAFCKKISDQGCLKRLHLCEESVSHVGHGLFARALSKIEDVNLCGNFSVKKLFDQCEELFNALAFGTDVKKLSLTSYNLSDVDAGQFSMGLSRLVEAKLWDCSITSGQIQVLFTEISPTALLKKLDLGPENLSELDPGLFSRVMSRMEDVVFTRSNRLTIAQVEAFFTEAAHSTRLKMLRIGGVDLFALHHQVLSQAVVRLEEVNLLDANLTQDQVQSLFSAMSRNTQINIDHSGITHDQAKAFFLGMSEPEDFGHALMKLKEVSLWRCDLSAEQVTAFLTVYWRRTASLGCFTCGVSMLVT